MGRAVSRVGANDGPLVNVCSGGGGPWLAWNTRSMRSSDPSSWRTPCTSRPSSSCRAASSVGLPSSLASRIELMSSARVIWPSPSASISSKRARQRASRPFSVLGASLRAPSGADEPRGRRLAEEGELRCDRRSFKACICASTNCACEGMLRSLSVARLGHPG